METIAILGAGDLGLSLHCYLRDLGEKVVGLFDDSGKKAPEFKDLELLGGAADIAKVHKKGGFDKLAFAIGYKNFKVRKSLFESLKTQGIPMKSVIHPTAYIHPTAKLGQGVHLFPGTILDFAVTIEDNVVVNTGSMLAHHAIVRAHSYFGPGARVSGFTEIGSCCFVGTGSTLIEKIKIGEGSMIAAGAVVIDNVATKSLMAGVPAVLKKTLE